MDQRWVRCWVKDPRRFTETVRQQIVEKRHLKVYHLIARSQYGLMVQILGGLITYLLLDIYCREQHDEPVTITRVRELRNQIANEAAEDLKKIKEREKPIKTNE